MEIDKENMIHEASRNARSLEKLMLTESDVSILNRWQAENIIDRCNQIIECMNECILSKNENYDDGD